MKLKNDSFTGNRYLTLNTVIRVNQIEVSRDRNEGEDENEQHTLENVKLFREAIYNAWPEGRITWSFSWKALHEESENYKMIREQIKQYHFEYGDDVTFIPGAYFANAYNSREQVNRDLHEGIAKVCEFMGDGFRPKSIVAGFLSSENQRYLAEEENIHVCQGNIWSQFAIDNQDGDGSICYPYFPSKEHFCKPAQSDIDFIDCVNLDGWSMDFLAARREGYKANFNSRMGVGPIETVGQYGNIVGLRQMIETVATHFDHGFQINGWGWVTNCWEISLVPLFGVLPLTQWLSQIKERWPDAKFVTQGEFGLAWREYAKNNVGLNYKFVQRGTSIGGSDENLEIRWFMNQDFRMALLHNFEIGSLEQVIDFTRYDETVSEPDHMTREWTLFGKINQKQTRPCDEPIFITELSSSDQALIRRHYPELLA